LGDCRHGNRAARESDARGLQELTTFHMTFSP
jgi:hypothetical protein